MTQSSRQKKREGIKMREASNARKGYVFINIGLAIMLLLTLTKIVPSSQFAGYSVLVGIAFFFITEGILKTPGKESGLRFGTFLADLQKPGVLIWVLLPIVSSIATLIAGTLIFGDAFVSHVVERTSSMLSFDKIPLLVVQVVIVALGEEIAYRGFFLGKSIKYHPFWPCALASALLFAAGHIAVGSFLLVVFDVATVFVDGLIYAVIYHKSGNCLISAVSHILCNAAGITASLIFFRQIMV